MINSRLNQHVFWSPFGAAGPENSVLSQGWYHWDEIGGHCYGPYMTERIAVERLESYKKQLESTPIIDYDGRN